MKELDAQTESYMSTLESGLPVLKQQNDELGRTAEKAAAVSSIYSLMGREADKTKKSVEGLNKALGSPSGFRTAS